MKKTIKVVLMSVILTLTLASTGAADEEKNTAEISAATEAQSALVKGMEDNVVLTIVSGLLIIGAVAAASGSGDNPSAHGNIQGH